MKKYFFIFIVGIILVLLIFRGTDHEEVSDIAMETDVQIKLKEEEEENQLDEQIMEEKVRKVISDTDRLNRMPKYEAKGLDCKAIEDTIERGDCFQKIIEEDWMDINWSDETDYMDFFFRYEERFFNSYQGTNPLEDIADSFTHFVISNSTELESHPEMKYKKLNFFYQYDELVKMRTEILESMYNLCVRDGEFY